MRLPTPTALVALAVLPLLASGLPAGHAAPADPAGRAAAAPTVTVDRAPQRLTGAATGLGVVRDVETGADGRIYALTPTSVRVFAAAARGNRAPVRTLPVAPPEGQDTSRVAVDRDGWVYVLSRTPDLTASTVSVFPPSTSTAVEHTAADLDLEQPVDLTGVGDEVAFIDNNRNTVEVYDLQDGGTTRTRFLAAGSSTQTRIFSPQVIDSDAAGRIVLAGTNWVSVFGAGADSTEAPALAPLRYLAGARTGLGGDDENRFVSGVGIDAAGRIVAESVEVVSGDTLAFRGRGVLAFAPGADGDVAPYAVLRGTRAGLGVGGSLDLGPSRALLTSTYDPAAGDYTAGLSVHRALGPYAAPGKPGRLRFTGNGLRRTLRWTGARTNTDTPVQVYEFKVTCRKGGSGTTSGTAVRAGKRQLVVRLQPGRCTASLRAINAIGNGAFARATALVRR